MNRSIVSFALCLISIVALSTGPRALTKTEDPSHHRILKSADPILNALTRETRTCGTLDVPETAADQIQSSLDRFNLKRGNANRLQPGEIVIPVHFHVINQGRGLENGDVPTRILREQVDVLNAGYSGATGGANTPFRFALASVDRTTNLEWFTALPGTIEEKEMKETLRVGDAAALNFYINSLGSVVNLLGWSSFPWNFKHSPLLDGVVLDYQALPGGSAFPYNEGDAGTHEVGHWLGLYHTFQNGCSKKNDHVADTPAEQSPAYACPLGRDSCPTDDGLDPVENFMDYTDNSCAFKFTEGQSARMEALAVQYRGL